LISTTLERTGLVLTYVVFANVGSKTWLQQRWLSMCSWVHQTRGVTVSHASYNSYLMYQNVHHALNHPWLCYSRHAMPPMGAFSRGQKAFFRPPRAGSSDDVAQDAGSSVLVSSFHRCLVRVHLDKYTPENASSHEVSSCATNQGVMGTFPH
jgi:hypothetical protein